ncbi:hypothetical protein [Shewanella halifaxensis]|uniref:hypothetical protein n=1 Tax=Shewanella halifaxensis TaxID=271098 RepID=UPI0002DB8326|nr:hypothetical protein [Shewanella halifaxensis]
MPKTWLHIQDPYQRNQGMTEYLNKIRRGASKISLKEVMTQDWVYHYGLHSIDRVEQKQK